MLYDRIDTIEIHSYTQRTINTLCLVEGMVDYTYKTTDRQDLQNLYNQRGNYNDILIVKEGMITDSYYANVAFHDGSSWYTPASPLLKGVQRQYLLDQRIIQVRDIFANSLNQYKQVKLFNSMMDWKNISLNIG